MQIRVQVKTGSSRGDVIIKQDDGTYLVYLRAKSIAGAANVSLIKLLSKYFNVSKSTIQIKNGAGSHYKTITID